MFIKFHNFCQFSSNFLVFHQMFANFCTKIHLFELFCPPFFSLLLLFLSSLCFADQKKPLFYPHSLIACIRAHLCPPRTYSNRTTREHIQMKPSSYSVVAQITSPTQCVVVTADPNGNHDSGYAPSNVDDAVAGTSTPPESPQQPHKAHTENGSSSKRNSANQRNGIDDSPKRDPPTRYAHLLVPSLVETIPSNRPTLPSTFDEQCSTDGFRKIYALRPLSPKHPFLCSNFRSVGGKAVANIRYGVQSALTRNDSNISTNSRGSRKEKKNSQASR